MALARESKIAESKRIVSNLETPMKKRMNFLRKRLPAGGSVL